MQQISISDAVIRNYEGCFAIFVNDTHIVLQLDGNVVKVQYTGFDGQDNTYTLTTDEGIEYDIVNNVESGAWYVDGVTDINPIQGDLDLFRGHTDDLLETLDSSSLKCVKHSLAMGYIKKGYAYAEKYEGRYGKGYALHCANREHDTATNRYHDVIYYVVK